MNDIISFLAPILSTLIICAGQLALNARFKRADEKRDAARKETEDKLKAEQEWRDSVIKRMDVQDQRIGTILDVQCTQMRSDIIHRTHRYMDDLGCASVEEKRAFFDEYEKYQEVCEANNIKNSFIDNMVEQVMQLPNRDFE